MCFKHGVLFSLIAASPALAVDVLVADRTGAINKIQRFDGLTGAFVDDFADASSGLATARGMTLGPDGRIYVSSYINNQILRYDAATGDLVDVFVASGSGGLNRPQGLAFNPQDGNLYVSSRNTDSVKRYQGPNGASPGAYIDDFVTSGSGGLLQPAGLVFGKDVWPPDNPTLTPHRDGIGELLVCSYATHSVKWYNGATGEYIKDFVGPGYNGLNQPIDLIFDPGPLQAADLLVTSSGNQIVLRVSGTCSTSDACGAWAFPFTSGTGGDLFAPAGLAYGPDVSGDNIPDLLVTNSSSTMVKRFRGPKGTNSGQYIDTPITGLTAPGAILVSCNGQPPAVLEAVVNARGLAGLGSPSPHTLRVTGRNLGNITGLKLVRSWFGPQEIAATSFQVIDAGTLEATFNLADAEGGRYDIVPIDPCGLANPLKEGFLVYLPQITNGSFEVGYQNDPTTGSVCDAPGPNGNRPKPKHWDIGKLEMDQQSFRRDGNIWTMCVANPDPPPKDILGGVTGDHYAGLMSNNDQEAENSAFQTIAAPNVDANGMVTELTQVRADCGVRSYDPGSSTAFIRLHDGAEDGPVIDEIEINSTDRAPYDYDGLVSHPDFHADVPVGYIYTSDPPLLTIELVSHSKVGDVCPAGVCAPDIPLALKAFHFDNVFIGSYMRCNDGRIVWADDNKDGFVDSTDFAVLQRCITAGTPGPVDLSEPCACFDHNFDSAITESDVTDFINCATGPAVPWAAENVPFCFP